MTPTPCINGEMSSNLTSKIIKGVTMTLSTTKLSSKGQVVIPEEIRQQLGLETGAQFIVMGEDDVVILKTIAPPSRKDFANLVAKARSEARNAGLTKQDVKRAIKKARAK